MGPQPKILVIEVYISRHMLQLAIAQNRDGAVAILKEWSATFVLFVEIHRVSRTYTSHEPCDAVKRVLITKKMEVVGHEAVGVQLDVVAEPQVCAALRILDGRGRETTFKQPFEILVIRFVEKYLRTVDATIIDVVEGVRRLVAYNIPYGHGVYYILLFYLLR